MLNLMFIRHAETELNKESIFAGRTDCNITKEGFEQAKEVLKDDEKNFKKNKANFRGYIT